jgi:hypothetical protein
MPEVLEPIAPPMGEMKEKVTPAIPGVASSVAKVELAYPERFQQITADINNANDPKARMRIADAVEAHDKETAEYRPNQRTQWDKVLVNVLSRNYNEALKWFNGGGVVEKEARDLNNNLYFREENDFGYTGRIRDGVSGKLLTPEQRKKLDAQGGIFTDTDKKALQTSPWVNGKYNQELANRGLTSQFQLATNDAYNSTRTASGANQNIDEQLGLTTKLKPVINHISALPKENRQKLLGYVNRLNQITGSSGTQSERGLNVNMSGQQTTGATAGGNIGVGGAGEGGVPPVSGKVGGGASIGANTSATTMGGASGREGTVATTSAGSMLQEQQTLQAAIMQELQGVIKSPAEFQEFMRLQSLNAANDLAYKNIPDHVKPAGWNNVPDTDLFVGGADAMIANRVAQQRNNALLAEWSKELLKAQREQVKSGKTYDLGELNAKFQESDVAKAINNTFEYKMKSHLEGRTIRPPKGSLMVNNRNQIGMSPGD